MMPLFNNVLVLKYLLDTFEIELVQQLEMCKEQGMYWFPNSSFFFSTEEGGVEGCRFFSNIFLLLLLIPWFLLTLLLVVILILCVFLFLFPFYPCPTHYITETMLCQLLEHSTANSLNGLKTHDFIINTCFELVQATDETEVLLLAHLLLSQVVQPLYMSFECFRFILLYFFLCFSVSLVLYSLFLFL